DSGLPRQFRRHLGPGAQLQRRHGLQGEHHRNLRSPPGGARTHLPEAWDEGGGFRFMFETFNDIATDEAANEEAAKFIRRKIAEIVKDPETARKLTPHDLYARRPLCDTGYFEAFNRANVTLVSVKENPIVRVTQEGIVTE